MKQIQEWLGHSDFSTTANIYAHLDYSSSSLLRRRWPPASAWAMSPDSAQGTNLVRCAAKKRGQMNQNSPVPSVWRSSRDLNPGAVARLRDFESRLFDHLSTAPDMFYSPIIIAKTRPGVNCRDGFSLHFYLTGGQEDGQDCLLDMEAVSASSKISLAWSSKTALEISSPRWAGRQCSTMWSGLARPAGCRSAGSPESPASGALSRPRRCSTRRSPPSASRTPSLDRGAAGSRRRICGRTSGHPPPDGKRAGRRRSPASLPADRLRSGCWPCCCRPPQNTASAPAKSRAAPEWSSGRPAPGRDGHSRSGVDHRHPGILGQLLQVALAVGAQTTQS